MPGPARRLALVLAVAASCALAPAAVRAQDAPPDGSQRLAEALEPYRRGRVSEAIAALQALAESPVDRDTLAQAYLHLGLLRAAMGDEDTARRDFAIALAIDPTLAPPPELGPSLRPLFDSARSAVGEGARLRLDAPEEAPEGEPLTVGIETQEAPAGLVAAHRLRVVPGEGEPLVLRREGSSRAELRVPAAALRAPGVQLEAEALTLHGAVIAQTSRALRVSIAPPSAAALALPEPGEDRDTSSGNVLEEPWLWIVVGAVVIGAGVGIGVGVAVSEQTRTYDLGVPMVLE